MPVVRPAREVESAKAETAPSAPTRWTVTAATLPTVRPLCSAMNSPALAPVAAAARFVTLVSMAFVPVPTPVPDVRRRLCAVTLIVSLPVVTASVMAVPATRVMLRWSVAPAVPAFSTPSTMPVAACTRMAPLFVTRPESAPIVTAPLPACTSAVRPSACAVNWIEGCTVPRLTDPLANTLMWPEAEVTSAWMPMSPASVCSRTLPALLPVAVVRMPPSTVRLPVVSTRET